MRSVKVIVKESTVVKPMAETPSGSLWLSPLDSLMPSAYTTYSRCVLFFRNSGGAANFFDIAALKAALSKALVSFYPYAGRLRKDPNGRLEVHCNAEGVVLVEAECDAAIDDLGFAPRADVNLLPKIDYSLDISSLPLSLLQITRFACGGVSLGIMGEHHLADGEAGLHYINTWSEIARGATPEPPFLDRRVLSARDPPQPKFPHIEHQLPPSLKTPLDITTETSFKIFNLSRDQINSLKQKCQYEDDAGSRRGYTSYESVAGHVWRSVCRARRLPHDQETKLQLPVDGRSRISPPLPPHLFANGIFYTTAVATCGEIEAGPLRLAAEKVHESVVRMDNEYMRSAVDYLAVQGAKSESVVRNVQCPNFGITSWVRLPFYTVDFGWGKPVYAGPAVALSEGKSFLLADPENEGGLKLAISLYKPHMELFEELICHI